MNEKLREILSHLECNPGASVEMLNELQSKLSLSLPDDYLQCLSFADGAEGFYGEGYWALYNTHEVPSLSDSSGAQKYAPGLILIAGNGGGTAYGIDTRCKIPSEMEYVELDLIGLDWNDVFYRTKSLVDLFEHYKTDDPNP